MSSSSYGQEPASSGSHDNSKSQSPHDAAQAPSTWGGESGSRNHAAGSGQPEGEFGKVLADLQDLVARAGNVSGEDLTRLRGQIADKFADAKYKVGELTVDAVAATRKGADATGDMIRSHPFPAVAVAALAGLAIGIVLARR